MDILKSTLGTSSQLMSSLKWITAVGALVLVTIFSLFLGQVNIPFQDVLRIVEEQIFPFSNAYPRSGAYWVIVVELREPEILGALVIGSTLAVGGAVIQSVFRNPITEPYIIGISSGAALGAVVVLDFGITILGIYSLQIIAFTFSVATVMVVYLGAFRKGRVPLTYLLLTGIAVSLFISSFVAYLIFTNLKLQNMVWMWLMGSLAQITWTELVIAFAINWLTIFIVALYWKELDSLQLGEEYATSVGINVERTKLMLILLVTLSTSICVSISGLIGFVGLVIPHVSRIIYGGSNRVTIPAAMVIGGIFLILCEDIANIAITQEVLPIGIVTGVIGAPFFLYLLSRMAGGGYAT